MLIQREMKKNWEENFWAEIFHREKKRKTFFVSMFGRMPNRVYSRLTLGEEKIFLKLNLKRKFSLRARNKLSLAFSQWSNRDKMRPLCWQRVHLYRILNHMRQFRQHRECCSRWDKAVPRNLVEMRKGMKIEICGEDEGIVR